MLERLGEPSAASPIAPPATQEGQSTSWSQPSAAGLGEPSAASSIAPPAAQEGQSTSAAGLGEPSAASPIAPQPSAAEVVFADPTGAADSDAEDLKKWNVRLEDQRQSALRIVKVHETQKRYGGKLSISQRGSFDNERWTPRPGSPWLERLHDAEWWRKAGTLYDQARGMALAVDWEVYNKVYEVWPPSKPGEPEPAVPSRRHFVEWLSFQDIGKLKLVRTSMEAGGLKRLSECLPDTDGDGSHEMRPDVFTSRWCESVPLVVKHLCKKEEFEARCLEGTWVHREGPMPREGPMCHLNFTLQEEQWRSMNHSQGGYRPRPDIGGPVIGSAWEMEHEMNRVLQPYPAAGPRFGSV